jgi:hypothetical protein
MYLSVVFACLLTICTEAQQLQKNGIRRYSAKRAATNQFAINEGDLKKDLYAMAGDHFRGRETGTLDELRHATWWADLLRKEGIKPAGDDGTYFQFFSVHRNRISKTSMVRVNDKSLQLWTDVLIGQTSPARVSAAIVYAGKGTKGELDKADVKGKAVAILASPEGFNMNVSLWERRYPGFILNKFRTELTNRGAAAIIFLTDEYAEKSWSQVVPALSRGLYDIEGGPNAVAPVRIPAIWLHGKDIGSVTQPGSTLDINIEVENFLYPSVNVIGKIDGTDPALSKESVLFSGHNDHDGVRLAYGNDSIYNGADDNGTVSVAMLAIARGFKKYPGKRSALFVWHGAEERGLLGSKWYASNPTVAKSSIVAVLNGDMIGRNHPDSAALLGSQLPHMNSPELVKMCHEANSEGPKFKLDTLWDKVDHIEGWYFRSDHLPYARAGIPAVFFTTLLHSEYHTPMDDPQSIDYKKLSKMTEWMYRAGWKIANAVKRPAVDPNFKLER